MRIGKGTVLAGSMVFVVAAGQSPRRLDPLDAQYREGLAVWRKPGKTSDSAACASCHAPDGLDLVRFDFPEREIRRRARQHFDSADTERVVSFLRSIRLRYAANTAAGSAFDRPFQPAGKVLPGRTAAERDADFGRIVSERLPTLAGPPIRDLATAKAAEAEMLGLNPWELPIGIPLSRISEDSFHGSAHATIAQWFPEVGSVIPPAERAGWYAMEDAYLQDPSLRNYRRLVTLHATLTRNPKQAIAALGAAKFRALLFLDFQLRHRTSPPDAATVDEVEGRIAANPIWDVGEVARDFIDANEDQLGMTAEMRRKKTGGPAMKRQLADLRVAWMWMGWLFDQGQYRTAADAEVRRGEWLAESLANDGPYPFHNVYAATRRQLVLSRDPISWRGLSDRRRLFWDYSALRISDRFWLQAPSKPADRRRYLRFAANCVRTNLWLLREDIAKTHEVYIKISSRQNARELFQFLRKAEPEENRQTDALETALYREIDEAKERR